MNITAIQNETGLATGIMFRRLQRAVQEAELIVAQLRRQSNQNILLAEGSDIEVGSFTGTKIGTSSAQKLGFWNTEPVIQQDAISYTADDESSAYTGIDNAQGGTPYAQLTDLNALRTAYENLRASYEDTRTKLRNTGMLG